MLRVLVLVVSVLLPLAALVGLFPNSGLWIGEHVGLASGLPDGDDLDAILADCQIRDVPGADLVCPERLPLTAFPPTLRTMLEQSEDRRFRSHDGVDWWATAESLPHFAINGLRALVRGTAPSEYGVRGASTLTQQVARLLVVGSNKTLFRKLREMIVAGRIERRRSKDQIEALYLNVAPLSGGSIGFEEAARRQFGKSASALDAGEAALLVGELPAPALRDPRVAAKQAAADRAARRVLVKWEDGTPTRRAHAREALAELPRAEARALETHPPVPNLEIRPYLDLARSEVDKAVPRADPIKLVLRIDPALQERVVSAAATVAGPYTAAGLFMRPGGAVAAVGVSDYLSQQFDPAFRALRPIGSVGKILTLIGGHGSGVLASSFPVRTRDPEDYPRDHDGACIGLVTFQTALAKSCNKAFAHLAERIGPALPPLVRSFGFAPPEDIRQVATGGIQSNLLGVARMLAALAHGGLLPEPSALAEVMATDGRVLQPAQPIDLRRVVAPSIAEAVVRDLRIPVDPARGGTGVRANSRLAWVWGKTGTSNDNRDAWFAGGIEGEKGTALVGGFWMGANDDRPMPGVSGGEGPAEAFRMVADHVARAAARQAEPAVPFGTWLGAGLRAAAAEIGALAFATLRVFVLLASIGLSVWLALRSSRRRAAAPEPLDGAASL